MSESLMDYLGDGWKGSIQGPMPSWPHYHITTLPRYQSFPGTSNTKSQQSQAPRPPPKECLNLIFTKYGHKYILQYWKHNNMHSSCAAYWIIPWPTIQPLSSSHLVLQTFIRYGFASLVFLVWWKIIYDEDPPFFLFFSSLLLLNTSFTFMLFFAIPLLAGLLFSELFGIFTSTSSLSTFFCQFVYMVFQVVMFLF